MDDDLVKSFDNCVIAEAETVYDIYVREVAVWETYRTLDINVIQDKNNYGLPIWNYHWMKVYNNFYDDQMDIPWMHRLKKVFDIYYEYSRQVTPPFEPVGYYWMSAAFRTLKAGFAGDLVTDPVFDDTTLTFTMDMSRPMYERNWENYIL